VAEVKILKEKKNYAQYVKEAVIAFEKIMSSNHKDAMDSFNRTNKGELFVLHFLLMKSPEEVMPSELSAALQSSPARISTLLGVLEKKGEIKRQIDVNSRRNILVSITEAGRERIKLELQKMQGFIARIFTDMGESDTREFVRLLKIFSDFSRKYLPNFS
jgi:DNA-binding MarR family transcriptional regulator